MLDNSDKINDLLAVLHDGDSNVQVKVSYPNTLDETELDELISPLLKLNECKSKKGLKSGKIDGSATIDKHYTFPDEEKSRNFVSSINKDFGYRGITACESMLKRSNFL